MSAAPFPSVADYYRHGPHAAYVQQLREPSAAPVTRVRTRQPAGAFPDPGLPEVSVLLQVSGVARMTYDMGTGRKAMQVRPGLMHVAPLNTETFYELDHAHELLITNVPLAVAQDRLAPVTASFGGNFGWLHEQLWPDAFLQALVERMWAVAADHGAQSRLFLDYAVLALLLGLLHRQRDGGKAAARPNGGLAPAQLRRVVDYMRGHLADDLSLDDLARLTNLSVYHFARAFKASTGLPPHRYRSNLRLAAAQELLLRGALPIAEVAARVGYGDPAHFAKLFRRATGLSPAAFRRAALG